ncbi:hypothetical protein FA95DRAFT_1167862 [Auriscalpium vulgare]|uniref:Uncharacterized protein n=1 Tax=Auriscalpium vulgare TaxID=40419 RepID=A0ACB8SAJ9_9AGAM|nr:hypothetical protein FA95DRAFT_1167862 [Auriscalpium vulgare]
MHPVALAATRCGRYPTPAGYPRAPTATAIVSLHPFSVIASAYARHGRRGPTQWRQHGHARRRSWSYCHSASRQVPPRSTRSRACQPAIE